MKHRLAKYHVSQKRKWCFDSFTFYVKKVSRSVWATPVVTLASLIAPSTPSCTPPYTAIHHYRTLDGTDFARARETRTLDNELKRKQKWHNFDSWVMQASSLYRLAHLSKSIEACVLLNNWALLNIINTVNIFLGRLRALFIGTIFGGYWFGQSELILRLQFKFVHIIILPTLYVTFLGETRV